MADHNYDDVPVHVRTVDHGDEGGKYVVWGVEVDGTFFQLGALPHEAFDSVLGDLKAADETKREGGQ